MAHREIEEYRPEGSKNFIRKGDRIRVLSKPGGGKGSKGFKTVATRILADEDGTPCLVECRKPGDSFARPVAVERVRRLEQTRNGQRIEAR
jgi:hypothetical protein